MNKCLADCAPDQYNDKRTDVVPNVNCGLFFNAGSLIGKLNDIHDFIYNRQLAPIVVGIALTRFVCVYRPPSCDMASTLSFLTALETVIAPLKADFPVLVMGDFNLTKIDWNAKCTIINHTNADRQLLLTSQSTHLL